MQDRPLWTLVYYYLSMSFVTSAISVYDVTTGTKMGTFFRIETKNGKNKMQGLKWEQPENVGTKMCFSPPKKKKCDVSTVAQLVAV